MLARRRRRRQEARSAKAIEQTARDIVQAELDQWKQRVAAIQAERQERQEHYTMVEQELRRHYDQACRQLEQRRDTLLATTSLIPYTQTIMQAATNFRVPAPLLTLQARLCLHVHCLCCHEELLLRTKEQGWDTIAWMEDVTQQLRLLTQKQVLLLKTKIINQIDKMKELKENVEIPEYIQETLQHVSSFDLINTTTADGETTAMTPSSAQLLAQDAYPDPMSTSSQQQQQGESFLDFLQRYEQRKEHRHKADQMRLAEFKSRDMRTPVMFSSTTSSTGTSATATNPYTSRRAGVGNKLKNYASTLFRASSTNSSNSNTMMDESMQLEELNSSHVPRTSTGDAAGTGGGIAEGGESTTSLASQERVNSATSRSSWLSSVKHRSASLLLPGPTDANLDAGWSLGSSWRGLRRIGRKSLPPDLTMMTTQPEVHQEEAEGQDDSQENLQQQQQQQQDQEQDQNEEQQQDKEQQEQQNKQEDHDNSNTDLSSDTEQQLDDINLDDMAIDDQQNKDKSNGNHQEPASSNGEQQPATTDSADNADAADAADGTSATRQQTKTDAKPTSPTTTMTSPTSPTSHLSPLKEKLKAPVTMIHQHTKIKLAESAR